MSGYNLPSDYSQAAFDRFWNEQLDDDVSTICPDCERIPTLCVCEVTDAEETRVA